MTGISLHMQCAMASDFSVAWQRLSKRTIGFKEQLVFAGWFVFERKIPIWVDFGGPLIGKC
jgi:hypothetical protein